MVAVGFSDDLIVGFILGVFVGLLAGPLFQAWLAVREWRHASRQAELFGDALGRIEEPSTAPSTPVRRRAQEREA